MRLTSNEPIVLEPINCICDGTWSDLQPHADFTQRQCSATAEVQKHQYLIPGKRQAKRTQDVIKLRQEELVHAHDRRHHGHTVGRPTPAVAYPLPPCLRDEVEGERRPGHARTIVPPVHAARAQDWRWCFALACSAL